MTRVRAAALSVSYWETNCNQSALTMITGVTHFRGNDLILESRVGKTFGGQESVA